MRTEYNIYCDESCHLEHDGIPVMVFGAIWCLKSLKTEIFERIKEIKQKHGFRPDFEVKWNKVSSGKVDFYMDLVDYFFDDDHLHFRTLVVPNKMELDHHSFNQDHDTFYYKMYFDLLKTILSPSCSYNIYLDIKSTQGQNKILKLQEVLRNSHYDFHNQIINKVQQVQSHEVGLLQITDLLTGAISYTHRGLVSSAAKLTLISRIKSRSGYSLCKSTLYKEDKFNIFIWTPKNCKHE